MPCCAMLYYAIPCWSSSALLVSPLSRDAIAKTLYSLLFGWLTDRINKLVYPRQEALSIAILDIYGFEVSRIHPSSIIVSASIRAGGVSSSMTFSSCRTSASTALSNYASTMPMSTCSSSSTRSFSRRSRWAGK